MNSSTFTPGPWFIDPKTRGLEVCTIHGMPRDERTNFQGWACVRGALDHVSDDEEEMANAHLIAQSPAMYEFIGRLVDDGFLDLGWHEEAEELMAKARGEQPSTTPP